MKKEKSSANRWRFSYSVLLPIVLATLTAVGVVASFVSWSMNKNDELSAARQKTLVAHLLDEQDNELADQQSDVAAWDEAVTAVTSDPVDFEWINSNIGEGLSDFFGHDLVFVLNPSLDPLYSFAAGRWQDNSIYESERQTIEPLARRLKEIAWQGATSAYSSGLSTQVPNVTEIIKVGIRPALIGLVPIISDSGSLEQAPGAEYIQVSVQFLDNEFAKHINQQLLLGSGRFTTSNDVGNGEISLPLLDGNGHEIVKFAWLPERPGAQLLEQTAPVIFAALFAIFGVITILVLRLRRTTSEIEAGRAEAQHLAFHDALTGLGNRALYERDLAEALTSVGAGTQVAVLMLDLDRFKQVNDTLGHAAGDELIREVGARLRPLVRASDTIVRLGGDEFAIIARHVTATGDVSALSQRIIGSIRAPFTLAAGQAYVGVSIGIAITPDGAAGADEISREADIALYDAKVSGRNRFKMFQDEMNADVRRRQAIEDDLRQALADGGQIEVEFHPLVRENGIDTIGVEAALVWQHPENGVIPPETFIPIAESTGLIEALGEMVLRRTCEAGATAPEQIFSVKVYPAQLRNPSFFEKVFSIVEETKMIPAHLEMSVPQEMLGAGEEIATSTLKKLRQAGLRIAIADFGTGFASLNLLQQFQIDRIQIDKTFFANLSQSPDPEAITHAVVWLARAIGVEVTADGVSSEEQKKFLARMGCMSFLGSLFTPTGQAEQLRLASNAEVVRQSARAADDSTELWDTGT